MGYNETTTGVCIYTYIYVYKMDIYIYIHIYDGQLCIISQLDKRTE